MMFPLLSFTVFVPLVSALLADRAPEESAARRVGIRALATSGVLGLLALVLFDDTAHGAQLVERTPAIPAIGARWALGVDGLSVVLSPVVSLLGAAILVAAPRGEITTRTVRAVLLVVAGALGGVLSLDPLSFFLFWSLALVAGPTLLSPGRPAARRAYVVTALLGTLALALALALVHASGQTLAEDALDAMTATPRRMSATEESVVLGLSLVAVLCRMAVPPFHSWLPVTLRDGRTPAAVVVVAGTSLGLTFVARLPMSIAPDASAALMEALVVMGIGSALYGAFVGLGRDDLRSAVGSVVSSQSALTLVGVASLGDPGVSGALLQGVATIVPCTGLLLSLGAVYARTGTTDATRLGGLVRRMPRATAAYFFFAIALVGFPGSLAFVSEDLLLHGLIATHPAVAIVLLAVTALNGLTVLRGGVRTFLGPAKSDHALEDLSPRERGAAFAMAALLALVGLAPEPLLSARRTTSERMIDSATGTDPGAASEHTR